MTARRSVVPAIVLVLVLATVTLAQPPELRRVPAVVHLHSDHSTGENSYEELFGVARRSGVEALLFTEEQQLRIEYSFSPFRALTRVVHEERSVFVTGVERYLERIADVRRRLGPDPLLIAGVEVLPHYWWTGSPFDGTLTLRDHQKNLHVFGVTDAATIRRLPSIGNPHTRRYAWSSLLDALPVLLVIPGVALLVRRRSYPRRLGPAVIVVRRRRWVTGGALVIVGLVALVRGWPFTVDAYPWWVSAGVEPQQALIDEVDRLGGVTMWSFPEAFDEGRRKVGPAAVSWRTDAHADDLLRTVRYTAFGALYAQTTRFVNPGAGWDRMLAEYAAGERSRAPWAMGEEGAHAVSRGRGFGGILTVFLVPVKSEAAILEAFRRGRMYALQRTPDASLVLTEWSVAVADGGEPPAVSGDTLKPREGTPIELRIAVDATGSGAEPTGSGAEAKASGAAGLKVTLVRNGTVLNVWSGDTSVRATHREIFDGRPLVFRIDARARVPHRLVSNPIFVMRP